MTEQDLGGNETGLDEEHSKGELRKEYEYSVMRQKRKVKILGWGKTEFLSSH